MKEWYLKMLFPVVKPFLSKSYEFLLLSIILHWEKSDGFYRHCKWIKTLLEYLPHWKFVPNAILWTIRTIIRITMMEKNTTVDMVDNSSHTTLFRIQSTLNATIKKIQVNKNNYTLEIQ